MPFLLFEVVHWEDTFNTHVVGRTFHCLFRAKRLIAKYLSKTYENSSLLFLKVSDPTHQLTKCMTPLLKSVFKVMLLKLV